MQVKRLLRKIYHKLLHRTDLKELTERGLKLGRDVHIGADVMFDQSHCWLISIGDESTLAPRVHILAHDASTKRHIGYTKIGRVIIGPKTFVGAGAMILPGVTVGDNCIIGAGSVVTRDVPSGTIVCGNPAVVVGQTAAYAARHALLLETRTVYSAEGWTVSGGITSANKDAMVEALKDGIGYVE